jgi:hypothetical protein
MFWRSPSTTINLAHYGLVMPILVPVSKHDAAVSARCQKRFLLLFYYRPFCFSLFAHPQQQHTSLRTTIKVAHHITREKKCYKAGDKELVITSELDWRQCHALSPTGYNEA